MKDLRETKESQMALGGGRQLGRYGRPAFDVVFLRNERRAFLREK